MKKFLSLTALREQVKTSVIGQEELVDKVTLTLYKHLIKHIGVESKLIKNTPNNLLIMGDTGTGKTFSVKETAKLLEIPFIEINGKSISQEGWEGISLLKLLQRNLISTPVELDRHLAIIFIDEFDKICKPLSSSNSLDVNQDIQASILKYIEGISIDVDGIPYDTTNFCFIFAGAFVGLLDNKETNKIGFEDNMVSEKEYTIIDKLIEFGMIPELAGRMTKFIRTKDITETDYRNMLLNNNFIGNQWFSMFRQLGYDTPAINYSKVINEASSKRLGVRGLIQALEDDINTVIENNADKLDIQELYAKLIYKQYENSIEPYNSRLYIKLGG